MDKIIDVKERYSKELKTIDYAIKSLEHSDFKEEDNKKSKNKSYILMNIAKLKESIDDLIDKIEYNKKSEEEKFSELMQKMEAFH